MAVCLRGLESKPKLNGREVTLAAGRGYQAAHGSGGLS